MSQSFGVSALFNDELVTNPDKSYREPSKVDFKHLMDRAGLDFRRVVEVYSRGYDSRTTLAEQEALIRSLNEDQKEVTFVLVRPKQHRTWWDRLLRRRAAKDTIGCGPCGCYPCNCELFCDKLSRVKPRQWPTKHTTPVGK